MKAQSFQSALLSSLFLHVLLVIAAVFGVRHSSFYKTPAPYVVSLMDESSSAAPRRSGGESPKEELPREEKETQEPAVVAPPPPEKEKPSAKKKEDESLVQDRIAALEAKRKIEKLASLRKVIDIAPPGSAAPAATRLPVPPLKESGPGGSGAAPSGGADYYSLVVSKIRQQWVYPETLDRDVEAVISIRIAKDGSVTIDRLEKSSGNRLFDRSVMSAITKASPLPAPPPGVEEIGVRFRP
ncbi:MAG: TonB C-terminal domain-containing protein [Alphaproteobacteria bacterium]|uniref:TonB C-terminal domain-containing protein n=1 Tax=Candidatus Nitrobium versatile TaxID=2884831 RepID=A0A953J2C8_9BACT|nr:TonB C-terminal domain-containing protein [Candidatus Nitrobium versatile]